MSLTLTSDAVTDPAPLASVTAPTSLLAEHAMATPPEFDVEHPTGLFGETDGLDDSEPGLSSYARCSDGNGTLSYLFFSDDDLDLARAKAICRSCGMQESCLTGAVEREEPYGVWGGKLVLDGTPVDFKRKRGRPPKNPAPILVVDEAPIPPHLVA